MENFNELQTGGKVPNKDSGSILSHSFEMYKDIFVYPLVVGLFLFIILSILLGFSGLFTAMIAISQEAQSLGNYNPEIYDDLYTGTPFLTFLGGASVFNIFIFSPLVVGTIYVAHKKNIGQQIDFSDLFIGFKQNFLNIIIFGLIFSIATAISSKFFSIPGIFLMPFLFLGYPFLLFQNSNAFEALQKSFEIAKNNYVDFLIINLIAYICSILGVVACCVGIIVTYMFYYSTMYSAYCAYVALPRELEQTKNLK